MCRTGAANKYIDYGLTVIVHNAYNVMPNLPFNANEIRSLAFEIISQTTERIENSHILPLASILVQFAVGRIVTLGQTPQLVALTM